MKKMKREVKPWTIEDIYKLRDQISFPDYQRAPKLWTDKDKQLLIDSILQNIDIPKLYFNALSKDQFEVVDGQQRLWAIWQFLDNEYVFKAENKSSELAKLNGKKFIRFPKESKKKIRNYVLQVTQIKNASDKYLRELFLRLQLGLLLITGEKLKASVGKMKDFIFDEMVKVPFIAKVKIPNKRYAKQTLCAQICSNSISIKNLGEFSRTRYEDLNYFFEVYKNPEGKDLDFFEAKKITILKTLNILDKAFRDDVMLLRNRSFILSVYLLVEEMNHKYNSTELKKVLLKFVPFSIKLLERLKEEARAGFNRKNEELYRFESYLSNAPGEKYQIKRRHEKLKEFFEYYQMTDKIMGD